MKIRLHASASGDSPDGVTFRAADQRVRQLFTVIVRQVMADHDGLARLIASEEQNLIGIGP